MMLATVPFVLVGASQPLIVFEARVNDSGPLRFILDTGAGPTLITPALAARLGVESDSLQTGHGVGGTATLAMATARSIQIGPLRKDDVPIGVTDALVRIGQAIGAPVDGDLGHTFFGDLSITVDYARRQLTFATEADSTSGDSSGVPFELVHEKKPLVEVSVWVDGKGPYPMALDTGASTTVLSPALADLAREVRDVPGGVTGAGGTVSAKVGRVRSLRVGTATQPDVDVVILDALGPLNQVLGKKLMGILGYNFLRHYRVTLDYPRQRLRLIH